MAGRFFMTKSGDIERDIETYFGIHVMQVRGLNPPNPKEIFTREWATEDGVDYYVGTARKIKASEVTIQIYIEDYYSSAILKYRLLCDWLLAEVEPIVYRDTVQYQQVSILYNSNKPAWYELFDDRPNKLQAEFTFINPTGAVTDLS